MGARLETQKKLDWSKFKILRRLSASIFFVIFAGMFCLGYWHLMTVGKLQANAYILMEPSAPIAVAEFMLAVVLILISIERFIDDWRLARGQYRGD